MDIINYMKIMPLKVGDTVRVCDFETATELYEKSDNKIGCLKIMKWNSEATIIKINDYDSGTSYTLQNNNFNYIREWLTLIG